MSDLRVVPFAPPRLRDDDDAYVSRDRRIFTRPFDLSYAGILKSIPVNRDLRDLPRSPPIRAHPPQRGPHVRIVGAALRLRRTGKYWMAFKELKEKFHISAYIRTRG